MTDNITEQDIAAAITAMDHFDRTQGVVWLPQQRMGCGYGNDFARTIDVFGIATTKPWTRFCMEIKVSRSDFKADLRAVLKQRRARMIANKFYYVAPPGIITPDDVPLWAGYAEYRTEPSTHIRVITEAPWMESSAPTWRFVAQLARRAMIAEQANNREAARD